MIKSIHVTLLFFFVSCMTSFAQNQFLGISSQLESGIILSSFEKNPFWMRSNQYGTIPIESQLFTLRGSLAKDYDSTTRRIEKTNRYGTSFTEEKIKKIGLGFGLNLIGNISKQSKFLIPEAYLKVRFKSLEIYFGRRKEIFGLTDTTLTSGSYIWSGNALPLPKTQISIPNYVSIIGRGLFSIKFSLAHGWFGNQVSVKNYFLHQKTLYGRIGRENSKLKIYGGINHQVQWGGYNVRYKQQFATGFYPFLYSLLPLKGVSEKAGGILLEGDLQNRVGNQLGSIDIMANWTLSKKYMLSFYRQSFYDQGAALLRLANIKDGLNGISLTNKTASDNFQLKKINFEFFYSLNQGTEPLLFTKTVAWELENYFTHYQYTNGWTYNNKVIGTPFITNYESTKNTFPRSFQDINNDRVRFYYLSFLTEKKHNLRILCKFSYSENYGLREFIDKKLHYNQFSATLQFEKFIPQKKLSISSAFAFDTGDLYEQGVGLNITVRKQFNN